MLEIRKKVYYFNKNHFFPAFSTGGYFSFLYVDYSPPLERIKCKLDVIQRKKTHHLLMLKISR
jgi:hypothetical protein